MVVDRESRKISSSGEKKITLAEYIFQKFNQKKVREAAKKSSSASGKATKREGGIKAGPRKRTFLLNFLLFCS